MKPQSLILSNQYLFFWISLILSNQFSFASTQNLKGKKKLRNSQIKIFYEP